VVRLAALLLGLLAIGVVAWQLLDDAPSRQEFADQANEICREAERSLENVGQNAESREEIANAVDRVIEESRSALDELGDLERPEGDDGETAERFVNATRREIEDKGIPALEDLRDGLESGNQDAAREAARRLREIDTEESNQAARDLGATACAES
jgi:hypothetical protein